MSNYNSENGAILRVGYVSDYDPKAHMARVSFPDKCNLVSAWLSVIVPNTLKNKDEFHLDINEHVLCVFLGNGLEAGFVLGSFWDRKNRPPVGNQDIRQTTFEDGSFIKVDRKNHLVEIHSEGNINISATGNIKLNGARIDFN